ncbi:MAG: ABC-2 transporter permease [Lachnospiraceae bacterium]
MKGLLVKDFKLMKGQQSFFIIVVLVSILTAVVSSPSFVIAYLSFIGSAFTLSTLSYDEFDNGNAFLFSLPITRTEYILEKYGFALITGGAFWLAGIVIAIITQAFKNPSATKDIIIDALAVLPVLFIILAVMFPFQLKFGGEKGRIAIIAAAGAVAITGVIIFKISEMFNMDLSLIYSYLQKTDIKTLILAVIVVSVLILFISFKTSLVIIYKKEF